MRPRTTVPSGSGHGRNAVVAILVLIPLLAAMFLWFPMQRRQIEDAGIVTVPDLAVPSETTSTTVAPTTTTPTATTRTTRPLPPPPPPLTRFEALTPIGAMTWERFTIAQPASVGESEYWNAHGPLIRPDGSIVVVLTGEQGAVLFESADGTEWQTSRISDTIPTYIDAIVQTDNGLVTAGWDDTGPRVWYEVEPGRWEESTIARPESPAPWLTPQWSQTRLLTTDGGIELFSGYYGYWLDWKTLLGDTQPERWWHLDGTHLMRYQGEVGTHVYDAELEAGSGTLTVTVTEPGTGDVVRSETVETPDAEQIVQLVVGGEHDGPSGRFVPLRWHSADGRQFSELPATVFGASDPWAIDLTVDGDRIIAAWIDWDGVEGNPHVGIAGQDGSWTDLEVPGNISTAQGLLEVAARDGAIAVLGASEDVVELAPQVTARGVVQRIWVTQDAATWTEIAFPGATLSTSWLSNLTSGPAGWAITAQTCVENCVTDLWLSTDALTWSPVTLPIHSIDSPGNGIHITDDHIYVLGWYGGYPVAPVLWVGTID